MTNEKLNNKALSLIGILGDNYDSYKDSMSTSMTKEKFIDKALDRFINDAEDNDIYFDIIDTDEEDIVITNVGEDEE